MKNIILTLVVGLIIGGIFFLSRGKSQNAAATNFSPATQNNVSVADGNQIVSIGVKGGYTPQTSSAKADMPTVLRMKTDGTFDCSSGVVIPSLSVRKILPSSGETDIPVPPQKAGTTLQGLCVMGMYRFQVQFN